MKKQSILYMILAALALSVLVAGVRSSEAVGGPDATLAAWAEAAATATPAPTHNPNGAPATGDNTPIGMYVAILAVCVVLVAAVAIVMVKRKKNN